MAVNIGPRIGIDGESEYRKQIQNIIQETKTLKSEYEALSSQFDKGKQSLSQNKEMHRLLGEEITAQKSRIDQLKDMVQKSADKFGEADPKTLKWKEALNKATAELNGMQKELDGLPSQIELVGKKIEEAAEKIKKGGKKIEEWGKNLAPISTAAAGLITGASKEFMDFEHQMSRVKAISGATGEEFQQLNDKAKEMGATTKYTATEAGEAFEYMGMAGWKSEQMLAGIAPIMDLASASGEELGTTSDIVTDALTAFGLKAEDAAHFADVLAAASTNSNTNVSMMGESFKYVGSMAGSLNYSIEDVGLALGLMANSGIKASMAGTTLRSLMQRMTKTTKESGTAMQQLGISIQNTATGEMYSFGEILDQLRDKLGGLNQTEVFTQELERLNAELENGEITEDKYNKELEDLIEHTMSAEDAEKARYAAMLAGSRGMAGLLAITNATSEDYHKLKDAIDYSSYSVDGITEKLEQSGVEWEKYSDKAWASGDAMKEITETVLYGLTQAGQSAQDEIDFLVNEYDMTQADAQKVVDTIVQGMGEAGGAAHDMAQIMEDDTAGAMTRAMSALNNALIEFGEQFAPTIEKVATAITDLSNQFSSLDDETKQKIAEALIAIAALSPAIITIGKVVQGVMSIVSAVAAVFAGGFATVMAGVAGAVAAVASFVDMWKNGWSVIKTIIEAIGIAVATVAVVILAPIEGIGVAIAAAVAAAVFVISQAALFIKEHWTEIVEGISKTWKEFTDSCAVAWKELCDGIQMLWNGIVQFFTSTVEGIKQIWNAIVEGISRTWKEFTDSCSRLWRDACNAVTMLWNGAKQTLSNGITAVKNAFSTAINGIKGFFTGLWEKVKSVAGDIKDKFSEITGKISSMFKDMVKGAVNWGKDLIDNFIDGIKSMWNKAKHAVEEFADMIADFLGFSEPDKGPLSNFHTYAPDMMKLFAKGIKDNERLIESQIERSFDFSGIGTNGIVTLPVEPTPVAYMPDTAGNSVSIGSTQIVINAAEGQSAEEIAERVDEIINMRFQRAQMAWA